MFIQNNYRILYFFQIYYLEIINSIKEIEFSGNFDALICLNGLLPDKKFFARNELFIIAADGAASKLIKKGIMPNVIIGDLDSVNLNNLNNFTGKVVHLPDQEKNDFEKVLQFSLENKLINLLITGFHGGDLEHTLNNYSVLKKFSKQLNLCIFERNRYAFPVFQSIKLELKIGEIISLIPMVSARLTTRNLKWELNNEKLEIGFREGARNLTVGNQVTIKIHEGSILLFCDSQLPNAPILK